MTQAERDRLVALKKAKKKLITQKQAAEELGITERHVRRLLRELKRRGDKVVAHGLRGLPSNRKLSADTERDAAVILSQPVYRGFGPTLAAEYLAKKHKIDVSRETVRQWMIGAKLWWPRKQRIEKVHEWHPRRSRFGELVQWDTSDHDWLEGRGEERRFDNTLRKPALKAALTALPRLPKRWRGPPRACKRAVGTVSDDQHGVMPRLNSAVICMENDLGDATRNVKDLAPST